MKKLLIISILLGSIILAGCSNNKEVNQISNEPDVINATISWL
jgi:outer membrane murein-binding lipoprotein Lpp